VYAQDNAPILRKMLIFYSSSCHECFRVENEVMPEIAKEFEGRIKIEYRDIGDIENYKLLLGLEKKHGPRPGNSLPVFYLEGRFLAKSPLVSGDVRKFIIESLGAPAVKPHEEASLDLTQHLKTFKPLAIVSAGLIDGINPCAFTVIVFFISFLALQGYRKIELVVIGLSFIFAVFLTYLLLGLGLFGFLYKLRGFWVLVRVFNFSVGIISIVLGILCVYDIFKLKKTANPEGMLLQLPQAIKNQIHRVIGLQYRLDKSKEKSEGLFKRHILRLVLAALATGFLVSILEAICTGQMYLPTIAFVLKTTPFKLEALGYLVLYNLMFITPLLVIFIFALWGVTSAQFAGFLRKYLLAIKVLMATMFFGLGIFLLWRA